MAVTINFVYPITGAGPPTAAQVALLSMVQAQITASADADTTAVITHNLGLTAAQLAAGFPQVNLLPLLASAQLSLWIVTAIGANSITCTKTTAVGSGNAGVQLLVTIERPHTITQ